jgi:phage terminase large subunit
MSALMQWPAIVKPWLFERHPFKVMWGGRGGVKSWTIARYLIMAAHGAHRPGTVYRRERILCAREIQASIRDSVHRLIRDQIELLGLSPWFYVSESTIRSRLTGSEFLFKGLRHNSQEVKSTEGITKTWVEEAQMVSKESWDYLLPTVFRTPEAELLVSFNPNDETDDTYQRFVVTPPPEAIVVKTGWQDNPWFPPELDMLRRHDQMQDPDAYEWIWEGMCKHISEAVIFRGKFTVNEDFETPDPSNGQAMPRFYHGSDFGFANNPTCLIRSYVTQNPYTREETEKHKALEKQRGLKIPLPRAEDLWIDAEAYGWHVDIDKTPQLYDTIPTSRTWPIKADAARPETISALRNAGFAISAAEKWQGSVEDGITYLRGFRMIHIHARCKYFAQEARLYKYKVDRITGDVLPVIVKAWDHGPDALRYGHDGLITRSGVSGWANL